MGAECRKVESMALSADFPIQQHPVFGRITLIMSTSHF